MRALLLVLSMIAMLATANSASAGQRVAMVLGNGTYKNVEHVPNAPVSAKAMTALLQSIGFDVVEGIDLTRDAMTAKLLDFGKRASGADIAAFYYAGHGIALGGTNYLLPVDADIKSRADVRLGAAIDIDLTLDQTMSDAKVKLVFLDSSRNDPFAAKGKPNSSSRAVSVEAGLAEMKSAEGTLLAFATAPGQTVPDGPPGMVSAFTRALVANIAAPGVEIQQAMTMVRAQVSRETNGTQLPMGNTNLIGAVYLNPVAVAPIAPAASK
jgi:uncharacterized caspase-like protein